MYLFLGQKLKQHLNVAIRLKLWFVLDSISQTKTQSDNQICVGKIQECFVENVCTSQKKVSIYNIKQKSSYNLPSECLTSLLK